MLECHDFGEQQPLKFGGKVFAHYSFIVFPLIKNGDLLEFYNCNADDITPEVQQFYYGRVVKCV
jgi:hypothetical protein